MLQKTVSEYCIYNFRGLQKNLGNFRLTWAHISVSIAIPVFWIFCHFVSTFVGLVSYFLKVIKHTQTHAGEYQNC